jgi:YVTN family beta-propeller protein
VAQSSKKQRDIVIASIVIAMLSASLIVALAISCQAPATNALDSRGVIDKITLKTPGGYYGAAYDSDKGEIFVTNADYNSVSVLSDNYNTEVAKITVGKLPLGVIYDSGKSEIFVANYGSNSVSVISDSNNSVVANVAVGGQPSGVAYDSGKGEIFIANRLDNTISVISDSNNSVLATVNVGNSPYNLVYDSAKNEIFVIN